MLTPNGVSLHQMLLTPFAVYAVRNKGMALQECQSRTASSKLGDSVNATIARSEDGMEHSFDSHRGFQARTE